jgi:adenylate cyclase
VSGADRLRLGGEKRELTVLFSDIRNFTAMSEAMSPEDLVKLMNEYFTAMTDKVFEHRGSLDKYIGDAVMAVYGAPVAEPRHAALACHTALEMLTVLDELKATWKSLGLPLVDIGVGINTGPMIVGNMGSANRFNYTVVGDSVNLASRVESLNKTYGTNILVSEYTYEVVKDEFPFAREIDNIRVRGRTQPVRLYELMREARYKSLDWLDEYRAAYKEMREGERVRAYELFSALHARSGDLASGYHARICKYPPRRQADS